MLLCRAALAGTTAQPVATTGFGAEWGSASPPTAATIHEFTGMGSATAPITPPGLDQANGVDVEPMIGDYMAVENIAMKLKKDKLEYKRGHD